MKYLELPHTMRTIHLNPCQRLDDDSMWKNKTLEREREKGRGRGRRRERRDFRENSYQRKHNVICPANDVQGASRREENKRKGKTHSFRNRPWKTGRGWKRRR